VLDQGRDDLFVDRALAVHLLDDARRQLHAVRQPARLDLLRLHQDGVQGDCKVTGLE